MKVCMNGLRKNLTNSFNEFMDLIKEKGTLDNMDDWEKDQLENIRMFIGGLNCCYDPDNKNDWDD